MIFLDRGKRGEDPHLEWKVRFFFLGALLALLGMAMELAWLVGIATGVLLLAVGLRFLPRRGDRSGDAGDEQ